MQLPSLLRTITPSELCSMPVTWVLSRSRGSFCLRKVSASPWIMALYPRLSMTRLFLSPNWLNVRFSPATPKTNELVSGEKAASQYVLLLATVTGRRSVTNGPCCLVLYHTPVPPFHCLCLHVIFVRSPSSQCQARPGGHVLDVLVENLPGFFGRILRHSCIGVEDVSEICVPGFVVREDRVIV